MSEKTFSTTDDEAIKQLANNAILNDDDFDDDVEEEEVVEGEEEEEENGGNEADGSSDDDVKEEPKEQSTSRNVGKKYKRWSSNKEREKHYKRLNNGATITTRKKIGEEKVYPPIPEEGLILEGYSISQFGRVRLQNGSISTGSGGERAYIELPHYKSFIISRLVASSFGLLTDNSHDVDHIDPSHPLDNSLSNLQTLSRKDHSLKTHKDNPHVAIAVKKSLSKPIYGRKLGSTGAFQHFVSSRDAEAATGANSANIRSICAKRQTNPNHMYYCGGYEWKYAERDMGETVPADATWKTIFDTNGDETPHSLCQHGLVRRGDGFVTRGCIKTGRYEFGTFQVSILVALYFLPPPSRHDQTTVNHKDLNPLNNHVSNLEWASDLEQVLHSRLNNPNRKIGSITKKCKFRTKESEEWTICNSIIEASKATGVSVRALRKNFNRETFTEKGYKFEEIDVPLLPGENFIPLRLYFKEKLLERRAPKMLAMLRGAASVVNN